MDKVTRILLLYSMLLSGREINKQDFCRETDSIPRSFDRDIEDIRLYLSETYSSKEILYDRSRNSYYMSGSFRSELEPMEYRLVKRLLLDSGCLRTDEMEILLRHLASNTGRTAAMVKETEEDMESYQEPVHEKAVMKIHGDLEAAIRMGVRLRLKYEREDGTFVEEIILPCFLAYSGNTLCLFAFIQGEEELQTFEIGDISSFQVLGKMSREEKELVKEGIAHGKHKI